MAIIKILNLDKLTRKFGNISGIDLMPEIKEGTRKVQRRAKKLAPNNTGFTPSGNPSESKGDLKNSIKTKLYPEQQTGVVYTTLEYAPHNEFGTRFMKAQPFMNPALNIERIGIYSSMQKYLRDELKKRGNG